MTAQSAPEIGDCPERYLHGPARWASRCPRVFQGMLRRPMTLRRKWTMGTLRHSIRQCMDVTGKDTKRDGGIEVLRGQEHEAALNLLAKLAEYGLFVVRGGELESWLKSLG